MLNNILIMTVNRESFGAKNYIDKTIESLETNTSQKYNLKLVVGSPDTSYLEKHKAKHTVISFPSNKWNFYKDLTVREKAIYNYYRCLSLFGSNALIFEDDVLFTKDWDKKLIDTINDIEKSGLRNYVLSLYSSFIETKSFDKSFGFLTNLPFYGTQGMYYPSSLKKEISDWIYMTGVIENRHPYDVLITDYSLERKIPIVDCKYSLVQHMAPDDSTGLSFFSHKSPSFIE